MQANLLEGPVPYLQRDEIKHFLRAYFNGFASAFYPEIRMCNEHSKPELGYSRMSLRDTLRTSVLGPTLRTSEIANHVIFNLKSTGLSPIAPHHSAWAWEP
jgi:hypothetical protein